MLDLAPDPVDTVRIVRSHRAPEHRDDRPVAPPTWAVACVVLGMTLTLLAVCGLCATSVLRGLAVI